MDTIKRLLDEELKKYAKDIEGADRYFEGHCAECNKKKTNRAYGVDLCFNCARKKAKSLGHNLTKKEYDESLG